MEPLAIAVFLATVNKSLIDWLAAPIRQRYPQLDTWWLIYVALGTGFLLGWLSGVNLFVDYLSSEAAGRVLTGLLVGGGSSLIHDVFKPGDDGDDGEATG